MTVFYDILT